MGLPYRVALGLGLMACGHDESLLGSSSAAEGRDAGTEERFDLADSRSLDALRDARTRQGLCNLLGWVSSTQGSGDPALCQGVVDTCSQFELPEQDSTAPSPSISNDLSGLLACAATASTVDGCVADLLGVARDSFADATCSQPVVDLVPATALLRSADCTQLLLACPSLFVPLLQALQAQAAQQ